MEATLEEQVFTLREKIDELSAQINGMSDLIASLSVDLYAHLIEYADESEDQIEAGA
jgi:hypothetical protein